MPTIYINNIEDSRLAPFASLTEAQLRQEGADKQGVFIAESPKVIRVAIECGYVPTSMLCEERHIAGDAADIIAKFPDMPVFTGAREMLENLTGYKLTRGVLCTMHRKSLPNLEDLCKDARLVAVLEGVCDTTNIGAIFRSASAMGVDAVVLSADSCDPLNRRAVRVSMGTVFTVPWTKISNPEKQLRDLGFTTAALALSDESISLDDDLLKRCEKLAVIFGTEGDGLPQKIIADSDYVVKIPMYHNVDSLNVAAAAAVTFWELRKNN